MMPDKPLPTPIAISYDCRKGRARKVFHTNRAARRFYKSCLKRGKFPKWTAPYNPEPTLFPEDAQ